MKTFGYYLNRYQYHFDRPVAVRDGKKIVYLRKGDICSNHGIPSYHRMAYKVIDTFTGMRIK